MTGQSRFAEALQSLLDDTDLYNRSEWARYLGSDVATLLAWLEDKEFPRSDQLHMIVDI